MKAGYPPPDICDVVGSLGRNQLLSLCCCLYLMAVSGWTAVFLQLLAPRVALWPTDPEPDPDSNRTVLDSTDCSLQQVQELNLTYGLVHYTPYSTSTLTEKLGLICERSWLVSLSNSAIMVGAAVWTVIFGQISEKYGRRRVILLLAVPLAAANLCILLADHVALLVFACFVYGGAIFSINNATFVTVVEMSSMRLRPILGSLCATAILTGQVLAACLAWLVRHWFYLQLGHLVFASAPLLFTWYMVESPIWLTVRGRDEEAREVLRKVAARNGLQPATTEPAIDDWLHATRRRSALQTLSPQGNLCHLFGSSTIRTYTIGVSFVLLTAWVSFFGLSMNVASLGHDLFQDLFVSSGLSLVSCLLTILFLRRASLRQVCCAFYLLQVAVCALYPFLYESPAARSALATLARLSAAPPLMVGVNYVAEIFPTSVRSVGFGLATTVARVGAAASPFFREIGVKYGPHVPFLFFGVLSLVSAALLVFALPETRGRPLPQTLQDLHRTPRGSLDGRTSGCLRNLVHKL